MADTRTAILNAWFDSEHQEELAPHMAEHWESGVPIHPNSGPEVLKLTKPGSYSNFLLTRFAKTATRADTQLALARKRRIYLWAALCENPNLTAETFSYIADRLRTYKNSEQVKADVPRDIEPHLVTASLRTGVAVDWLGVGTLRSSIRRLNSAQQAELCISAIGASPEVAEPFQPALQTHRRWIDAATILGLRSLAPEDAEREELVHRDRTLQILNVIRNAGAGRVDVGFMWSSICDWFDVDVGSNIPINHLQILTAALDDAGFCEEANPRQGVFYGTETLRMALANRVRDIEDEAVETEVGGAAARRENTVYLMNKVTDGIVNHKSEHLSGYFGSLGAAHWVSDSELWEYMRNIGRGLDYDDLRMLEVKRDFNLDEMSAYATPGTILVLEPSCAISNQALDDMLDGRVGNYNTSHLRWLNKHCGGDHCDHAFSDATLEERVRRSPIKRLGGVADHQRSRLLSSQLIDEVCGAEPSAWEMLFTLADNWEGSFDELLTSVSAVVDN